MGDSIMKRRNYSRYVFNVKQKIVHGGITNDMPSGIYFYRLRAGGFTAVRKMVLMKATILIPYFFLFLITPNFSYAQVAFNKQVIIQQSENDRVYSVFPADMDGDGDSDILSAYYYAGKIAWLENSDGLGTFHIEHVINTDANAARCVCAADLDGDGDMDVLSASQFDDKVAWYENTDGLGAFGPQQIITTIDDGVRSIRAVDLDSDNDIDVLSASYEDNKIAWFENTDGLGSFGAQRVISDSANNVECVYSSDLDGDGDNDILFGYMYAGLFGYRIAWYENIDGGGTFNFENVIIATTYNSIPPIVCTADLDSDGDMDVLSASPYANTIAWYENTDGEGTFSSPRVITDEFRSVCAICTADLDNDGDADVLSASDFTGEIAWFENYGNKIHFGPSQVITSAADGVQCICTVDLDGDGDLDVLAASDEDARIVWYENVFIQTQIDKEQRFSPNKFNLSQNYPNPFNTSTLIRFTLSKKCLFSLKVYDLSGRVIETLMIEQRNAGVYDILWDAKALPSGIYLYRLETEDYCETKKLILQK
jgi:hypothetical protein